MSSIQVKVILLVKSRDARKVNTHGDFQVQNQIEIITSESKMLNCVTSGPIISASHDRATSWYEKVPTTSYLIEGTRSFLQTNAYCF